MTKPKKAKKWNDSEPLSSVFKRLHRKGDGGYIWLRDSAAFYWWSCGVVDERRQRGDYDKKRPPIR